MKIGIMVGPGSHAPGIFSQLDHYKLDYEYTNYWPRFEHVISQKGRKKVAGSYIYDISTFIITALWHRIPIINRKKYHLFYNYSIFDRISSFILNNSEVLMAWSQMSLCTMRKVKKNGGTSILEHPMVHVKAWTEIVKEEYKTYGDKNNLQYGLFTSSMIDRMLQEYELADYIHLLSSYAEHSFIEKGVPKEKIVVSPLGVDHDFFKPHQKLNAKEKFVILCVGRLELLKGTHRLLKVFSELKLKNAELWLVGNVLPEMVPFLKQYGEGVKCLGVQSKSKLVELYNSSDLVCLPSIQESFGLVLLEAMACGVPIAASIYSGAPDIIQNEKEGSLFNPFDEVQLKQILMKYYEKPELGLEKGKQARKKIESEFTLYHYGKHLMNLMGKVHKNNTY